MKLLERKTTKQVFTYYVITEGGEDGRDMSKRLMHDYGEGGGCLFL